MFEKALFHNRFNQYIYLFLKYYNLILRFKVDIFIKIDKLFLEIILFE